MKALSFGIALSALCGLFSGCATIGQGIDVNMTSIPKGKGVVLFSTEAQKTSASMSTSLSLVNGISRHKYGNVIVIIDAPFHSDFPGRHGNVRTLTLPAGEYYFVPSCVNPFMYMAKAPVYKFEVKAGTLEYIGNFSIVGNQLHWSNATFPRDLAFFKAKNPKLAEMWIDIGNVYYAGNVANFKMNGMTSDLP